MRMVPRARIELARPGEESQDFKSCASTNFATGAREKYRIIFSEACHYLRTLRKNKNLNCAALFTIICE